MSEPVLAPPGAPPPEAPLAPPAEAAETGKVPAGVLLGVSGAIAGLLIAGVFGAAEPTILANRQARLEKAVVEVLASPEKFERLYVIGGGLAREVPAGTDPKGIESVYLGYGPQGKRLGFAVVAAGPGFQDTIRLIYGYDPAGKRLTGMKVLESKETPGLGDKIEKDASFVGQFVGRLAPLLGVKPKAKGSDEPNAIVMITGATISSRAIVRIINTSLARMGPMLHGYWDAETRR
ncbi:MAG: FMN-binding protein [Candidatus Sericytochromatia bacterium]|nr:FMN-binding protein [Candidatus Tanganyikabacteria bacterium]